MNGIHFEFSKADFQIRIGKFPEHGLDRFMEITSKTEHLLEQNI